MGMNWAEGTERIKKPSAQKPGGPRTLNPTQGDISKQRVGQQKRRKPMGEVTNGRN